MEKGHKIEVLDGQGYIKLIDWMGNEEAIVEGARMSTGKGFISWGDYQECKKCQVVILDSDTQTIVDPFENHRTKKRCDELCDPATSWPDLLDKHSWETKNDTNFINFLWRHKHATPFELCELHVEVVAPIFVFREWHRHRTWSYNEFSARYAQMPNEHYVPAESRFGPKASANKQEASISSKASDMHSSGASDTLRERVALEQEEIYDTYEDLLECGVPKEVARVNTPVSRMSKMRAKTDLRNVLAFLNLRHRPGAQFEIRMYAEAMAQIVKSLWPKVWACFEEYDLYGAHLSRTELKVLRYLMECGNIGEHGLMTSMEAEGASKSQGRELVEKIHQGGLKILA